MVIIPTPPSPPSAELYNTKVERLTYTNWKVTDVSLCDKLLLFLKKPV